MERFVSQQNIELCCPKNKKNCETSLAESLDVVLCPDGVPAIDRRFDCCDLS